MHPSSSARSHTFRRVPALPFLRLLALGGILVLVRPVAAAIEPGATIPMTAAQQRILTRAGEILKQARVNDVEQQVRLQVIRATMTGTTIRPGDDYPEMRNPKHWTLDVTDDAFVVAASSTPVEAIDDLWVVHENDGVPIPRIRCFKYSSLIFIEGFIRYFREAGNAAGLAAINRLIGQREIPNGLPGGGHDLLWKQRDGRDNLLPGDQVWFDNPFFKRGGKLLREESYQQALRDGQSPAAAAATADAAVESATAGEEGSNVFFLGDDTFIRGATNVTRLCRTSFQSRDAAAGHEQILTPKTFTLARYQEHMLDDNYTAQACLRANPGAVHPADFKIESVRSPSDPGNLLRLYADAAAGQSLVSLIDAVASHNKAPRLVKAGDATVPLFAADYDWSEQQRVRAALDSLMRIKSDDSWWPLRDHIHDERYVLTATHDGVAANFTLGALCSDLIDSRLCLGFTAHLPLVAGRLPATFLPEQEYWQHETQWAGERKPLHAMQTALCERAITQWETVRETLPGCDGQAHIYTADEKARFVAALQKEIAARKQTQKAAAEDVVVPCLPAPGGWEGFDAQRAQELLAEYQKTTSASK